LERANFSSPGDSHDDQLCSQRRFRDQPPVRRTVEERIARLEKDAAFDEAQMALLKDGDHIRRHMRLVACSGARLCA